MGLLSAQSVIIIRTGLPPSDRTARPKWIGYHLSSRL